MTKLNNTLKIKIMDIFNELSKEKKRDLFIGVYNLMVRSQRDYGWVV